MSVKPLPTVLIADDDQTTLHMLRLAMQDPKWNIIFCSDGQEALELCQKKLPDLALLDLNMPFVNGSEICQWLKNEERGVYIPVLMLTADNNTDTMVNNLELGADDYVVKPYKAKELKARMSALLRVKELTDELRITREALLDKERQIVAMQVAGAAAHELGQPLTALMLLCDSLSGAQDDRSSLKVLLDEISSLTSNIRSFLSRLQSIREYKTKPYEEEVKILDLD